MSGIYQSKKISAESYVLRKFTDLYRIGLHLFLLLQTDIVPFVRILHIWIMITNIKTIQSIRLTTATKPDLMLLNDLSSSRHWLSSPTLANLFAPICIFCKFTPCVAVANSATLFSFQKNSVNRNLLQFACKLWWTI